MGDVDVQACGSSSAAVWGLAARGTGFGDFADARVAGDYQPAEGKGSFFEAIVRVGKVEPTCEARLSPLGKKLDRTQCREVVEEGFVVLRLGGDPYAVVAECLGIVFLPQDENSALIHVDGVAAEHGARPNAWREDGILKFFEDKWKFWSSFSGRGFTHGGEYYSSESKVER